MAFQIGGPFRVPGWWMALAVAVLVGCSSDARLTVADLDAMRATVRQYGEAWVTGHPDSVMSVFAADPVLSPSGLPFVEGEEAARDFWWPAGGPPTSVTRFEFTSVEAEGAADRGFVRGTFVLEFEYNGESFHRTGKFLSLQQRQPDGWWRITHQFWDDLPDGAD